MARDFAAERKAKIAELMENAASVEQETDALAQYVEKELSAAFKRGIEWARKKQRA